MKQLLFILSFLFINGCYSWKDDNDLKKLVPELKKFKNIVVDSINTLKVKDSTSIKMTLNAGFEVGVNDEYRRIVESNFNRLFDFLNQQNRDEFYSLFKMKKIVMINIFNEKCIYFKVLPDFDNNLFMSSWEELYVVYDKSGERLYTRIGETAVADNKIQLLEENWYRVIVTKERYIGM